MPSERQEFRAPDTRPGPIRRLLSAWELSHPGAIEYMCSGSDAKLLIGSTESERHPDWLVYLSAPPQVEDPWSIWVPEIVVEVVTPTSARRDYDEKPDEYLEFGLKEYWIVDPKKRQILVRSRWRGQWRSRVVAETQRYATDLLPGFKLDLKAVFAAGRRKR